MSMCEILAADVRRIRSETGLTTPAFAAALGVSERTVRGWESGGTIPDAMQNLLAAVDAVASGRKRDLETWASNLRARFEKAKGDGK